MKKAEGFTIVELLVVIVVIGILATITIVSYANVSQRARLASASSDLSNASTQLKVFQVTNESLPLTIDCSQPDSITNKCIKSSSGATYNYTYSGNTYCVDTIIDSTAYRIASDTAPEQGTCLDYGLIIHLDANNPASYPGSGTTWTDLSGRGNNATLYNGPTHESAGGGYFTFDGTDDYARVTNNTSLNLASTNHTLTTWFYAPSVPNDSYGAMIWRFMGGPDRGYYLGIQKSTGEVAYDEGHTAGNVWNQSWSKPYVDSTWHLATETIDISGKRNRLYVDGVQVNTTTLSYDLLNYSDHLSIGGYNTGNSFLGRIADVRIYNRAMTAIEVAHFYDSTKSRFGL